MELLELTALELGRRLKKKEIGVEEAVAASLGQIQSTSELNAYITVFEQEARAQARQVQQKLPELSSPLAGVPMALKDNILYAGQPATCASRMLQHYIAPYHATVTERLLQNGAIVLGKLNMDEFAMGSTTETSCFGPTRNPWDRSRVPGGSSGGCAASLAARSCFYALGSDTGGSVRQPAAFCNVCGLKPTYGSVSRYGLVAYASSLDQIGPMARDAADLLAIYRLIAGKDEKDMTSQSLPASPPIRKPLTVGIIREAYQGEMAPAIREKTLEAAKKLEELGMRVEERSIPLWKEAVSVYYILACAEAAGNLARYDGIKYGTPAPIDAPYPEAVTYSRSHGFGAETRRRILLGNFVLSAGQYEQYYQKAKAARREMQRMFAQTFATCDLLLSPVTATVAPQLGQSLNDPLHLYLEDRFTLPASLAGLPAVSLPCGFDDAGLPLGFQLMGPLFGEEMLLETAVQYQKTTDFHRRRPPF